MYFKMAKKGLLTLSLLGLLFLPALSLAVGFIDPVEVPSLTSLLTTIKNVMWIVLVGFALVCFVIAGIMFLTAMGDPGKLKIARSAVIFGAVGIAVGILAYSVVAIISSVL
jgi:hypothetical protein